MKAIIEKEQLQKAITVISKLSSKPSCVVLDFKDNGQVDVVTSTDVYVKYSFISDVKEKGDICLEYSMFLELSKLRAKKITLTHYENDNSLTIEGGSKLSIFVLPMSKDLYEFSGVEWTSKIDLPSKSVGLLKNILNKVSFTYLIDTDEQASIVNTSKNLIVKYADNSHSAHFTYNEPLCDTEFEFNGYIGPIHNILNFIDTKVKLYVNDNLIMFESENLVATTSARQDKQSDFIKQTEVFLNKDNYSKGEIVFNINKFEDALDSMSITYEDGSSPVQIKIKGTKMKLKQENSLGVAEDSLELESNTYGELNLAISLKITQDSLTSCGNISDTVSMNVGKEEKYFKLKSKGKYENVVCLNPFVS